MNERGGECKWKSKKMEILRWKIKTIIIYDFWKTFIIPVGLIYMRNVLRLSFLCQLFVVANSLLMPPTLHYRWTFQPFFLCSKFSIFPSLACSMPSHETIDKRIMLWTFFRVPPSWKQQEGFYKLILFNLNLFIAKNFFIMRHFSTPTSLLHIVRNNNENFPKKLKN